MKAVKEKEREGLGQERASEKEGKGGISFCTGKGALPQGRQEGSLCLSLAGG